MEEQIKATITSAEGHVRAAYDKLEEMGATMPAQKNIENLRHTIFTLPLDLPKHTVTFEYADGTSTTQEVVEGDVVVEPATPTKEGCIFKGWYKSAPPVPDVPDLSKVLTKQDLDDIQAIVAAGQASEKFQLGQTLLITYGSYTMPFEIVGFEDVVAQIDGAEQTVHALNLLAKYTNETSSQWGDSGSTKYSASTLRSYMTTTYQSKLDANFVACLANTKEQTYSRDGSTDVVYDKIFAPSMAQLGVTDASHNTAQQAAVEGPVFTAYERAGNAKRVKNAVEATGSAKNYWTRSLYSDGPNYFGYVIPSGALNYSYYGDTYRAVAACNFVAASTPAPASYTIAFEADGATNVPEPQTVARGGVVSRPADPVKSGYTFKNWLLNGEVYDFNTPVTSDITLVASFEKSYDPANPQLSDLKAVLATENPASVYPIGTEIPDTYNGLDDPLIIAQYLDSTNNANYNGANGVILIRKYITTDKKNWGEKKNYAQSNINVYLNGEYYNNCSQELKDLISDINILYQNGDVIFDTGYGAMKVFSMSRIEMCYSGTPTLGDMWEYWKQQTGLNSPSTAYNAARIAYDRNGTAAYYWLRDMVDFNSPSCVWDNGSVGTPLSGSFTVSYGMRPAFFVSKN